MVSSKVNSLNFRLIWALVIIVVVTSHLSGYLIARAGETAFILIAGAIVSGALIFAGLKSERIAFYFLVASLALGNAFKLEFSTTTILIIPGSIAVITWLVRSVYYRVPLILDWRFFLAISLGLWATLSGFYAGSPGVRSYWLVIILFLLTPNVIREKKHFVELGWILVISLGLAAGYVVFDLAKIYLQAGGALDTQKSHVLAQRESVLEAVGIFGMWVTKALPFALFFFFYNKLVFRRQRFLLIACVVLICLSIFMTLSINAIFGLGFTIMLVILLLDDRTQKRRLIVLAILATLILVSIFPVTERLSEQLYLLQQGDFYSFGTKRVLGFSAGIQLIRNAPIFGYGPNLSVVSSATTYFLPYAYLRELTAMGKVGLYPHNIFIGIGTEIGIPGLLLFVAILIATIYPLWSELRSQRQSLILHNKIYMYTGYAVLIGLLAFIAQGMGTIVHMDKYLWLFLGLGVSYNRLLKKKKVNVIA